MTELFRYIEQAFIVPSDTSVIDVGNDSDLQNELRADPSRNGSADRNRSLARDFIGKHFRAPAVDPFHSGKDYLALANRLSRQPVHGKKAVDQVISGVFDSDAHTVVGSATFRSDKELLDDALVCIKLTTAFDRVDAHRLVAMRQAVAFLQYAAEPENADFTEDGIRAVLLRPIRIPGEFLKPSTQDPDPARPTPAPPPDVAAKDYVGLVARQSHLQVAYETIMAVPPGAFELVSRKYIAAAPFAAAGKPVEHTVVDGTHSDGKRANGAGDTANAAPAFLAVPRSAIEQLGSDVRRTLETAGIDVAGAPVTQVVAAIKRHWQDVSRELAPTQVPAPAKVFRVGVHVFAVGEAASTTDPREPS